MADTQDNGRKSGLLGTLKSALGRLGGRGAKTGEPASTATGAAEAAHDSSEMKAVPVPEELLPVHTHSVPAAAATETEPEPEPEPESTAGPVEAPAEAAAETATEPATAPQTAPAEAEFVADVDLAPIAPEDVPVVGAEAISAEEAPSAGDETPFIEAPGDPVVDASWTVARLRTLARERGVRGYSSMSKAQLLGELSSPQA